MSGVGIGFYVAGVAAKELIEWSVFAWRGPYMQDFITLGP